MPNFKDGSFVFQVLEYLGVHLQVHLKDFTEDGIETVEKHSSLVA